jgi:DNA-binding CsgD family transcriptional regulator
MPLHLADELTHDITQAFDLSNLHRALQRASRRMGFDHFALNFDLHRHGASPDGVLLHDYPDAWAQVYVAFDLAGRDPVRRACDKCLTGFAWRDLPRLIPMTKGDRQMLAIGREVGLADGYTIGRHLPGESSGSCSFVMRAERSLPQGMLMVAELIGAIALAAARRLTVGPTMPPLVQFTDRQRECVLWAARGKTAYETSIILGISEETVIQHLKMARERSALHSRHELTTFALLCGFIGYQDIFPWWWRAGRRSG